MNTTTTPTSLPTTSQRRGKIARLPRGIRDQLNTRLDDGQEASEILPWLNDLSEVREILSKHFDAVPISAQNLSAWRNGGFQEWLLRRDLIESACHTGEQIEELQEALPGAGSPHAIPQTLANNLLTQFSLRLNAFMARWDGGAPNAQLATLLKVGPLLLKMQHAACRTERETLEQSAPKQEQHPVQSPPTPSQSSLIKVAKGSARELPTI